MKILNRLLILLLITSMLVLPVAALELGETPAPEVYEDLFPVPKTEVGQNETLLSVQETVLKDKSILFFGDSLTSGYGLDLFSQSWSGMLGSRYGMDVTCWSIAGSTVGVGKNYGYRPGGYYEPMCRRSIPSGDYDVIFMEGGGNDWYCEIPLGTDPLSRSEKTFMGALNVTIDRLQEAHPDALLLFSTSWNTTGKKNGLGLTTDDYNAAMLKVCQSRDIPCFAACDPTVSGIDTASAAVRKQYFLTSSDFWHLNVQGQELYLPTIAAWLQEMLMEHYVVAPFYDVRLRDWYAPAVAYAVEKGITNGTSANKFSPETQLSRGMMVTLLYRAEGSPQVSVGENPFTDVPSEQYYYDAVLWGYETGVTNGVESDRFAPEDDLTREQMVTMLYRFHGSPEQDESRDMSDRFSDWDKISDYAKAAMLWAVDNQVIHGMEDGTVAPSEGATRAQVVQILTNYYTNMAH